MSLEDITDTGFMYAKRDCKGFEIKSIDEYVICILKVIHNFWLMLSKSSKKKKNCLKAYHLDPARFLSAPRLTWQVALRKD